MTFTASRAALRSKNVWPETTLPSRTLLTLHICASNSAPLALPRPARGVVNTRSSPSSRLFCLPRPCWQVERLPFGDTLAEFLVTLDLRIELGAEQEGHVGEPKPRHQHDRARESPVEGAHVGHLRDVGREADRGGQPDEHSHERPRRDQAKR